MLYSLLKYINNIQSVRKIWKRPNYCLNICIPIIHIYIYTYMYTYYIAMPDNTDVHLLSKIFNTSLFISYYYRLSILISLMAVLKLFEHFV